MSPEFEIPPQKEQAPDSPVEVDAVRLPRYGRMLEEFDVDAIFEHPRGMTVPPAFALEFATTFMQANPLYLNAPYAQAHGFKTTPLAPLMVLNLALSQGVQNNSEQAIAHLGYYVVEFPHPLYPGDTIRSQSQVISRRWRGAGRPGVVRVRTQGFNQHQEIVVRYERAILIPPGGADVPPPPTDEPSESQPIPSQLVLPLAEPQSLPPLTGSNTYSEDFTPGEIVVHANGRTVSEEHMTWSYRLGNTHPLHYDRIYSQSRSGPLSGEPVVYGGLVFAWIEGLASRDTSENALWDVGYTEGYHTQPASASDTLYALSRVLAKVEGPPGLGADIISLQLVGLKNLNGMDAINRYGADLFRKESDKPRDERIPHKIFEIERRLLLKRRGAWPHSTA